MLPAKQEVTRSASLVVSVRVITSGVFMMLPKEEPERGKEVTDFRLFFWRLGHLVFHPQGMWAGSGFQEEGPKEDEMGGEGSADADRRD